MKQIAIIGLSIIGLTFFSCKGDSDDISDIQITEGCTKFNIESLQIVDFEEMFAITNGTNFIISFEFENEAQIALDVINHYNLDEYCTIGVDNTFSYFLVNGDIPEGDYPEFSDCIAHDVKRLEVILTSSGKFTVIEPSSLGDNWHYAGETEDEANEILSVIKNYKSSFGCYVGRPNTKMHFLRK